MRQAWTSLLQSCLPAAPANILDVGCGTGSLSVLLAGLGYRVTGIDFSPAMISLASAKAAAAGQPVTFRIMDAARPSLAPAQFDALLCRHLLWALPRPAEVLRRWLALLGPAGRLVLIEGRWHTGAGLPAPSLLGWLPATLKSQVHDLSRRPELWGRAVDDERYMIVAEA